MAKRSRTGKEATDDAIRPSEQLLIEILPELSAQRVLCTSLGRAQFARQYAMRYSDSQVTCLFLDIYLSRRAETATETPPENLNILCAADPPEEDFDLAVMPFTQGGEAELTRDLMQSAHERLRIGGQLAVSIDSPKDTWLHEEMQRLFEKVTRKTGQGGLIYLGTKRGPLKKLKNFHSEFKFRDGERLISVVTRPGVFSHRRLDLGAPPDGGHADLSGEPRVGHGLWGRGAFAGGGDAGGGCAGSRRGFEHRAIECTNESAALNGIQSITTKLNASAQVEEQGTFDVALANPPYYSNYRIAEIFLKGARRALKPGGTVWVVAKTSEWYEEHMPKQFDNVTVQTVRDYAVIRGSKR